MSERIELSGETIFTRNGEYEMHHRTEVTIDPGRVSTAVVGRGTGCTKVKPVVSRHPEVVRYHRDLDQALTVSAYQNRQVTPIPKPSQGKRRRSAPAIDTIDLCPVCGSRPNEVETCGRCDGAGRILINVEDQP